MKKWLGYCFFRKELLSKMWLIIVLVRNVPANMILCNPLSASPTKWSNTLKQFVGKMPANCLSVFDHFVWLTLKGLKELFKPQQENTSWQPNILNMFTVNNKDNAVTAVYILVSQDFLSLTFNVSTRIVSKGIWLSFKDAAFHYLTFTWSMYF